MLRLLPFLAVFAACDPQDGAEPPPADASPDPSPPPSVRKVEVLDAFPDVEIVDGHSDLLELVLPDDVLSLTLIVQGASDALFYGVGRLQGPADQILVAEGPPDVEPTAMDRVGVAFPGPAASPNRSVSPATGVATTLAPNNPDVAVTPGTWRLRILAADVDHRPTSTRAGVTALVKRGPSGQTTGSLPLHLHFTGAHGWTAESARRDPELSRALDRVRAIYASVGISVGEISYQDVSEDFRTVDDGARLGGTLEQMFASGRHETGVSVFLVERIIDAFGVSIVAGVAGGTPGPTLHAGTPRSGVAVATELSPDADVLGRLIAHEVGHYLGLFHTVEVSGAVDQIADTPEGPDGDTNLMFPTVNDKPSRLTDGQGWVLHRNASVEPQGD